MKERLQSARTRVVASDGAQPQPAVILNASSGADDKEEARRLLTQHFEARGLKARISLARNGAEIVNLARRAFDDGCDPIIAGGGDGTINAVASLLVETGRTLGVLPLGTLNHFAKDIGVPLDLERAIEVITEGEVARVDVGEVNARIFLNNSSLGLYPRIVRHREKQQRRFGRGKWLAFLWATLSALRLYPFLDVRLQADERELWRRTPFVFVGNNEYEMESFQLGGRSCLDAGKLSLYVAHRTGRLGLLRLGWRALFGGLRKEHDFDSLCAEEIWIATRHKRRLRVATDGEVTIMRPPLHYRTRPGALHVLVPKDVESQRQNDI